MSSERLDDLVVRPRSTSRKRRAGGDGPSAREPSQARSRERRDRILDAAEALLHVANIENLSLSDIGEKAEMSKASVHYHFPTVASIQLELGRRYDSEVRERLATRSAAVRLDDSVSWQEWMRIAASDARDYFNGNRAACETILGPMLHRQNRLTTIQDNSEIGGVTMSLLTEIFYLPHPVVLERALSYYGEILDAFWSGAYLDHGYIDDFSFEESLRAALSYLRNFLPEIMPRRTAQSASR